MNALPEREGIVPRSMGFVAGFARPMGHLPQAVGALFDAASRAGFRVREGKQQVMLFSGAGAKIGGWNKVHAHWYVSAVIAEGREALMRRHGFGFKDRPVNRHRWWQLDGVDGADGFRRVCESLTGDRIGATMHIGTEAVDGALVAIVQGHIDSANEAEFQGALLDAVGAHEDPVIVDCQGLDYLASAGLRVILIGAWLMAVRNAPFAVCSLSGPVAEVFKVSGFGRVIQTFPSREEALAAVVG